MAASLGLFTETNGDEGERFVTVRKVRRGAAVGSRPALTRATRPQKPPPGQQARMSQAELKELARKARHTHATCVIMLRVS